MSVSGMSESSTHACVFPIQGGGRDGDGCRPPSPSGAPASDSQHPAVPCASGRKAPHPGRDNPSLGVTRITHINRATPADGLRRLHIRATHPRPNTTPAYRTMNVRTPPTDERMRRRGLPRYTACASSAVFDGLRKHSPCPLRTTTGAQRQSGVHVRLAAESPRVTKRPHLNPGFKVVSHASTWRRMQFLRSTCI